MHAAASYSLHAAASMHAAELVLSCCSICACHAAVCTNLHVSESVQCVLQIQRNLATDGSTDEMQKIALLPDSKVKVGASLGYNVRTLLKDLGMEVRCSIPHLIMLLPCAVILHMSKPGCTAHMH